jgi:large subunit ribosomal protein L24
VPIYQKIYKKNTVKKSARVIEGDSITIVRGEFKGVDGKVAKISPQKSSVAIEGVKKEKTKGDKFDVYIHTSNLIITSLNSDDKWRMAKLQGKDPKKQPKETTTKENTKETTTKENTKEKKVEKEVKKKENEK